VRRLLSGKGKRLFVMQLLSFNELRPTTNAKFTPR